MRPKTSSQVATYLENKHNGPQLCLLLIFPGPAPILNILSYLVYLVVPADGLTLTFQPGAKMVTASKATVPTISDQASAMQLSQCAKNLASALAELRTASQKVRTQIHCVLKTSHQDEKGLHCQ